MSEWRECKLGEQINLKRGYDLPTRLRQDGSVPIYSSSGISGLHSEKMCEAPGVIAGRYGTIGQIFYSKTCYWPLNTALYVQDFKGNDELFVYYFLQQLDWEKYSDKSAVPGVNRNDVHQEDIAIPTLPEQKAIAAVLSSLDNKIDLLQRQNLTLEAMAETLFRQWFMVEAREDWEEKPLSFFGDIVCGKTPSKKYHEFFGGDIPFLKIPDMHGNVFLFKTEDTLTQEGKNSQSNKTLPEKSICVSCIATVGLVSITTKPSQTNQQINSIVPSQDFYRYFLYLTMKSSYDLLHALASGGTATLNLNTGNFAKITVPFAGDDTLKQFSNVVDPLFNKIYTNQKQRKTLETLRDTLLPKLMSGEVRVAV